MCNINATCCGIAAELRNPVSDLTDAIQQAKEVVNFSKRVYPHLDNDNRQYLTSSINVIVRAYEDTDKDYMTFKSEFRDALDDMRQYVDELRTTVEEHSRQNELSDRQADGKSENTDTKSTQESQAKEAFRLKYEGYIEDMDTFFGELKTINGRGLKRIFGTTFAKSDVTLKDFFADCEKIVAERKGEKGWNYEAIKKH